VAYVLPLGLLAGSLTTVAGLGGGMMLVLVLSLVVGPREALAVTAPALLLGNLHRLHLFRARLERRALLRFAVGALPASFVFGLLAVSLPAAVLHWLLLSVTTFAVARQLGWIAWRPGEGTLVPGGAVAGALTATTGGGGLVAAPLLLATGLSGEAYVATAAGTAVCMHVGRILAYGAGGLLSGATLGTSAVLAVAILGGNLLGRRVRRALSDRTLERITWGTLVVAVSLAVLGVA